MELHPDVVVHSLKVLVDPADGSYTPSLLIISAADSLSGMKEVAAVSVGLQVKHRGQMNLIAVGYILFFCGNNRTHGSVLCHHSKCNNLIGLSKWPSNNAATEASIAKFTAFN
jgi:hypothetical protein